MKSPRLFVFFTLLVYLGLVSSLSGLFTRQACESLICPFLDIPAAVEGTGAFLNGAGGALSAGWSFLGFGTGWVIDKATGFLRSPTPPDVDKINQQPSPIPKVDIELLINVPTNAQDGCDTAADSSPNFGFDQGTTNIHPCEKKTKRLVWPVRCDDTAQNTATATVLKLMDSGVFTSIDPLCPIEGGVLFWLAELTPQQTETMENQIEAVRAVERDIPYESEDLRILSTTDSAQKRTMVPKAEKRIRLEKRDPVLKQKDADMSLGFISTPRGRVLNSPSYAYFSAAGAGIRVYLIDSGAEYLSPEFSSLKGFGWLYGQGSVWAAGDDSTIDHGTCMASKITGKEYGVAKRADLTIAKIGKQVSSFIDVLGKIVLDLKQKAAKRPIKGYTVINVSYGWKPSGSSDDNDIFSQIETFVKVLTQDYQVVFVAASGHNNQDVYSDIYLSPAILSTKYDIITVGAVRATNTPENNGRSYVWSHGGPALRISAPGNGRCATSKSANGFLDAEGTSLSSAIVAGLVAYFLSLPDLGKHLREFDNLPKAVIEYLQFKSYPRYLDDYSVWNGLDPDDLRTEWNYWLGGSGDN